MAAAASAAAATHTGENMYSAIHFRAYYRKLKATCGSNKHACAVLNLKDPVTKFLLRNAGINDELKAKDQAAAAAAAEGVTPVRLIPTEKEVKEDPKKYLIGFLTTLEKRLTDAAAAEAAAADGADPADTTAVTPEMIDKLELKIKDWINGEAFIYNEVLKTIKNCQQMVIKVEDAGRAQLEKLETLHNLKAPEATETMIEIWNNFTIQQHETLGIFEDRFLELLGDMEKVKPDPIVKNTTEKRLKFISALEKGGRFIEELKTARRTKIKLPGLIKWLKELENTQSIQLYARHDISSSKSHNIPHAALQAVIQNIENYGKPYRPGNRDQV